MALPYKLKQSSPEGAITAASERKTRLAVGIPTSPEGVFHAPIGTIDWGCMEDVGTENSQICTSSSKMVNSFAPKQEHVLIGHFACLLCFG